MTTSKTIEEILARKPETRRRIYAYSIDDTAYKGLLKVGQTTRDVKQRIADQLKTAAITKVTPSSIAGYAIQNNLGFLNNAWRYSSGLE